MALSTRGPGLVEAPPQREVRPSRPAHVPAPLATDRVDCYDCLGSLERGPRVASPLRFRPSGRVPCAPGSDPGNWNVAARGGGERGRRPTLECEYAFRTAATRPGPQQPAAKFGDPWRRGARRRHRRQPPHPVGALPGLTSAARTHMQIRRRTWTRSSATPSSRRAADRLRRRPERDDDRHQPAQLQNLVAGTNDYRVFNSREGRNDGSGWAYSTFNGGRTWTDMQVPHLTFQTGATGLLSDMDSAGDPALAFGRGTPCTTRTSRSAG